MFPQVGRHADIMSRVVLSYHGISSASTSTSAREDKSQHNISPLTDLRKHKAKYSSISGQAEDWGMNSNSDRI